MTVYHFGPTTVCIFTRCAQPSTGSGAVWWRAEGHGCGRV